MRTALVTAALAVVSSICAQKTWIVDYANGPGTDFLDVPPALAAAVDGDLIFVRKGVYTAGVTSKALTLIGDQRPTFTGRFHVHHVASGKTFAMAGFGNGDGEWSLFLEKNGGRVHLYAMSIEGSERFPALDLYDNFQVTVSDGDFIGLPAVRVHSSWATMQNARMRGRMVPEGKKSAPAITVDGDAKLTLANIKAFGGVEGSLMMIKGYPGIWMKNGVLNLWGDAKTIIKAGEGSLPVPAVETVYAAGKMFCDPNVTMIPWLGAPDVGGPVQLTLARHPSVKVTAIDNKVTADVFSKTGDWCFLFAGPPGDQLDLGTLGYLWLDPSYMSFVAFGIVGGDQHWTMPVPLPGSCVTMGTPFGVQVLVGTGMDLVFTNTGTVVLR